MPMSLLSAQLEQLTEISGADSLHTDAATCAAYTVDGLVPAAVVEPSNVAQVCRIVNWAGGQRTRLVPAGSGRLLSLGDIPEGADVVVSLARLNRIVHYDPGDLTLGVEAGISLRQVQETLASQNQFLPANPPYGCEAHLGGLVATNLSGPWRYAYGNWRDFILGMRVVTGDGVVVRTGGRVVKNAAGYDLAKLFIGSLGTLGIIVEVNFRVFPRPAQTASWVAGFDRLSVALTASLRLVHSVLQPMAVELLDGAAAELLSGQTALASSPAPWSLVMQAGGVAKVIARYEQELGQLARQARAASFQQVVGKEEETLWDGISNWVHAVREGSAAATLLKASLPLNRIEPFLSQAAQIAHRSELPTAANVRAGAGIAYLALLPVGVAEASLEKLAQACTEMLQLGSKLGGSVVVEWCPTALKRQVNIWGALRADFALMQGLKQAFDPDRILNPGRFLGRL